MANPTPFERLTQAEEQLAKLNGLLEKLWVERMALHAAVVECKIARRNIELARAALEGTTP